MIVVAHPDDETIGMGAHLRRFCDALLVQITDGAPRDGRDAAAHGFTAVGDYAFARRAELYAALAAGRADGVRTEAVGIPDQEACFNLGTLTKHILGLLRKERPSIVFSLPYEGGHPDHDAAAFAVWAACRLLEAEGEAAPAIVEMTSYHSTGSDVETGVFLPADRAETTLTLNPSDRSRKRRMIDCFATQRGLLAAFGVEVERFRSAPDYDFTQPPHPGKLHYETLGWGITGALWRERACATLATFGIDARQCR